VHETRMTQGAATRKKARSTIASDARVQEGENVVVDVYAAVARPNIVLSLGCGTAQAPALPHSKADPAAGDEDREALTQVQHLLARAHMPTPEVVAVQPQLAAAVAESVEVLQPVRDTTADPGGGLLASLATLFNSNKDRSAENGEVVSGPSVAMASGGGNKAETVKEARPTLKQVPDAHASSPPAPVTPRSAPSPPTPRDWPSAVVPRAPHSAPVDPVGSNERPRLPAGAAAQTTSPTVRRQKAEATVRQQKAERERAEAQRREQVTLDLARAGEIAAQKAAAIRASRESEDADALGSRERPGNDGDALRSRERERPDLVPPLATGRVTPTVGVSQQIVGCDLR
jgi:hypothetical protein